MRQSSPKKVPENLQSQRLQYALRDKARTFGFRDVEIIDDDLGSSGAGCESTRKIHTAAGIGIVGNIRAPVWERVGPDHVTV